MSFFHEDGTPVRDIFPKNCGGMKISGITSVIFDCRYNCKSTLEFENIFYISDPIVKPNSIVYQNRLYSPYKKSENKTLESFSPVVKSNTEKIMGFADEMYKNYSSNFKSDNFHGGRISNTEINNCSSSFMKVNDKNYPEKNEGTKINCSCGKIFYTFFPIETDPGCDDCPNCGKTYYDKSDETDYLYQDNQEYDNKKNEESEGTKINCLCGTVFYTNFPIETLPPCADCPKCKRTYYKMKGISKL